MALKKKILPKKVCPVCDKTFQPKTSWQLYDKASCTQKAFRHRIAERLQRLDKLDSKGAA